MSMILRRYLVVIVMLSILSIGIYLLWHTTAQRQIDSTFVTTLNIITTTAALASSTIDQVHTETDTALPSSTVQSAIDSCELSLMESDGWFCETDADWKRRKSIHRMQDARNRNSDVLYHYFYRNWEPTIHCSFDQRIGNVGDGGKWICDIHKLKINNTKPLIYSFGSQGDFSFEIAAKDVLPNAEIHTFDSGVFECPPGVCTFHQATIGDGQNSATKSLNIIIDELGHQRRTIDILKIDIEGSEYNTFEAFFKHATNKNAELPYIRQVQMEIHIPDRMGDEGALVTSGLFELFRANNYAIFHKETNLFNPQICYEYAFIRLNPKFFSSF